MLFHFQADIECAAGMQCSSGSCVSKYGAMANTDCSKPINELMGATPVIVPVITPEGEIILVKGGQLDETTGKVVCIAPKVMYGYRCVDITAGGSDSGGTIDSSQGGTDGTGGGTSGGTSGGTGGGTGSTAGDSGSGTGFPPGSFNGM